MSQSDIETITINVYPWAEPTPAQRRWFDSLPADEKQRLIEKGIQDGFRSGVSGKSIEEIIAEADAELNDELQTVGPRGK